MNGRDETRDVPGDADRSATDARLVELAQADSHAFAHLYDRYVEPIYGYCYRRLGNVAAAEDATSTTFFKALNALTRFRQTSGTFRSWLFSIAHNVVLDQYRASNRRPERPLEEAGEVYDRSPSPEELTVIADEQRRLRQALGALTEDQRQVIELRLAGLDGPEIAQALGKSHSSVRTAQHRALQKLRAVLSAEYEGLRHDQTR